MINRQVDFYKTLQVHHDAGQDIIDAAYRCLSKMYHPDINKSPTAIERMKDINVAYDIIGDTKKRKDYHVEWLKKNLTKPYISSAFNKEKPKTPEAEAYRESKIEQELAHQVLDEFFCETVNERWEQAYKKLTIIDSNNVPLDDFLEWKRAVSQVYKLGNYKITYFRKYSNCDYAGVVYPVIFQFSVALTEMQIVSGHINEENTQKYVAFDGKVWRVCLGYTDLKPTITKFKYLAQALPKVDKDVVFMKAIEKIDLLTGVFSKNGFIEQAEREMLRSQRYGNPLSLACVTIKPVPESHQIASESQLDACVSYVSDILCGNIRKTDLIGRFGHTSFTILLTETKLEDAEVALNKFLDLCEPDDEYLNYKLYSSCLRVYNGNLEDIIENAIESVSLREKAHQKPWEEDEDDKNDGEVSPHTRLGKYRISDILGFNKKGKNHF